MKSANGFSAGFGSGNKSCYKFFLIFIKKIAPVSQQKGLIPEIPDPCTQAWDTMTTSGDGRFCNHCEKTVTDFTQLSDADMLAYIKKNGLGCGRFHKDQVQRKTGSESKPRKYFWFRWVISLLFLGGWGKGVAAQDRSSAHKEVQLSVPNKDTASSYAVMKDSLEQAMLRIALKRKLEKQQLIMGMYFDYNKTIKKSRRKKSGTRE